MNLQKPWESFLNSQCCSPCLKRQGMCSSIFLLSKNSLGWNCLSHSCHLLPHQVVKADAETQTSHGSHVGGQSPGEQTPPRRLRQSLAPRMLALSQRGILPACVSALAMREETEAHNRCCLRKLEMRVAPCWRDEQGFKEAEHSSLQVSSTQSPSTENDRRRTPLDSFSSLSSPLDHSSILKDRHGVGVVVLLLGAPLKLLLNFLEGLSWRLKGVKFLKCLEVDCRK